MKTQLDYYKEIIPDAPKSWLEQQRNFFIEQEHRFVNDLESEKILTLIIKRLDELQSERLDLFEEIADAIRPFS